MIYAIVADLVLIVHGLFVAFVVFGLLFILAGGLLSWDWVRNLWFRGLHLLAIGVVVVQAWLGLICPLTTWEMALRTRAGQPAYSETFVSYWLHRLLFYEAAPWVFIVAYSVFGALVVASWFWVRPGVTKSHSD